MLLFFSKNYVYQCINCNACMHKVHALVNFLLILACNDLMHIGIWTWVGNNQIEPYKMEKLKFWDKPYKIGKKGVEKEVLHPGIVPHFETRTVNKFWACISSHSKLLLLPRYIELQTCSHWSQPKRFPTYKRISTRL